MRKIVGLFMGLFTALLLNLSDASAHEFFQPQTLKQFREILVYQQKHYYLPGSEIAYINIPLLKERFEFIREWSDAEIRQWVLGYYARISELQLKLQGIRINQLDVDLTDFQSWFHPQGYNRAAISEVIDLKTFEPEGIMDTKGSGSGADGVVEPQLRSFKAIMQIEDIVERQRKLDELRIQDHSDGMMSLGEAIAELTRQQAVQKLFDLYNAEHGTSYQTIEIYFIIKTPVRLLKEGDQWIPAAIIGREGHIRGSSALPVPAGLYNDDFGKFQSSAFDSAIDFGGVVIRDRRLVPTFGEPFELVDRNGKEDAQQSRAWQFGHETAKAENIEEAVTEHLNTMLAPIMDEWKALPVLHEDEIYIRHVLQSLSARKMMAREAAATAFSEFKSEMIFENFDRVLKATEGKPVHLFTALDRIYNRPDFAPKSKNRLELATKLRAFKSHYSKETYPIYLIMIREALATQDPFLNENLTSTALQIIPDELAGILDSYLASRPIEMQFAFLQRALILQNWNDAVSKTLTRLIHTPELKTSHAAYLELIRKHIAECQPEGSTAFCTRINLELLRTDLQIRNWGNFLPNFKKQISLGDLLDRKEAFALLKELPKSLQIHWADEIFAAGGADLLPQMIEAYSSPFDVNEKEFYQSEEVWLRNLKAFFKNPANKNTMIHGDVFLAIPEHLWPDFKDSAMERIRLGTTTHGFLPYYFGELTQDERLELVELFFDVPENDDLETKMFGIALSNVKREDREELLAYILDLTDDQLLGPQAISLLLELPEADQFVKQHVSTEQLIDFLNQDLSIPAQRRGLEKFLELPLEELEENWPEIVSLYLFADNEDSPGIKFLGKFQPGTDARYSYLRALIKADNPTLEKLYAPVLGAIHYDRDPRAAEFLVFAASHLNSEIRRRALSQFRNQTLDTYRAWLQSLKSQISRFQKMSPLAQAHLGLNHPSVTIERFLVAALQDFPRGSSDRRHLLEAIFANQNKETREMIKKIALALLGKDIHSDVDTERKFIESLAIVSDTDCNLLLTNP